MPHHHVREKPTGKAQSTQKGGNVLNLTVRQENENRLEKLFFTTHTDEDQEVRRYPGPMPLWGQAHSAIGAGGAKCRTLEVGSGLKFGSARENHKGTHQTYPEITLLPVCLTVLPWRLYKTMWVQSSLCQYCDIRRFKTA